MVQVTAVLFMRKFIFKETFFAYIKIVKNETYPYVSDLVISDPIFLSLNLRQELY